MCARCGVKEVAKKRTVGFSRFCIDCRKLENRKYVTNSITKHGESFSAKYYRLNKDKVLQNGKENYFQNKERKNSTSKLYYVNNREKQLDRLKRNRRERIKSSVTFRLSLNVRDRVGWSLRQYNLKKVGSAIRDLGCTVEELKDHLESKFKSGMTWDNWGVNGWHIDHIRPLASFNLENREEFLQACHYTNLQPLWAGDNLSKGKNEIP